MSDIDVCRLCLATDDLVCIFDQRIQSPRNMKDIIQITTGVEIQEKDFISRSACSKCLQITIKMFKFRTSAQKNDKDLRIRAQQIRDLVMKKEEEQEGKQKNVAPKKEIRTIIQKPKIHPSVSKLFVENPVIRLPAACLSNDISPVVVADKQYTDELITKMNIYIPPRKAITTKKTAPSNSNDRPPLNISLSLKKTATAPSSSSYVIVTNKARQMQPPVETGIKPGHQLEKEKNTNEIGKKVEKRKADNNHLDLSLKKPRINEIPTNSVTNSIIENNSESVPEMNSFQKLDVTSRNSEGPVSYLDKTVTIRVCEICNAIYYSVKDLRSHLKRHMKCQFCKQMFKSMLTKQLHIEQECVIRGMMINLPKVVVSNIMMDVNIRSRYKQAFIDYTPLIVNKDKKTESQKNVAGNSDSPIEICLLSDDDDDAIIFEPVSNVVGILDEVTGEIKKNSQNTTPVVEIPLPSQVVNNDSIIRSETKSKNDSVIRPNIKIKNDFMGYIDPKASDIKIMKDLLFKQSVLHLMSEKSVQTTSPVFEDVYFNKHEKVYEFKNLKSQLAVYKIPVEIKNGTFGVNFVYEKKQTKKKKINIWFKKPIDIETIAEVPVTISIPAHTYTVTNVTTSKETVVTPVVKPVVVTSNDTTPLRINPEVSPGPKSVLVTSNNPTPLWSAQSNMYHINSSGKKLIYVPVSSLTSKTKQKTVQNSVPVQTSVPTTSKDIETVVPSTSKSPDVVNTPVSIRVRSFSELT